MATILDNEDLQLGGVFYSLDERQGNNAVFYKNDAIVYRSPESDGLQLDLFNVTKDGKWFLISSGIGSGATTIVKEPGIKFSKSGRTEYFAHSIDKNGTFWFATNENGISNVYNEEALFQGNINGVITNLFFDKWDNLYYILKIQDTYSLYKDKIKVKDFSETPVKAFINKFGVLCYSTNNGIFIGDEEVLSGSFFDFALDSNNIPHTTNNLTHYKKFISINKNNDVFYNTDDNIFKNGHTAKTGDAFAMVQSNEWGSKTGDWQNMQDALRTTNFGNISKNLPATGAQENTLTLNDLGIKYFIGSYVQHSVEHPAITGAGTTQTIQFTLKAHDDVDAIKHFDVSVTLDKSLQQKIDELSWTNVTTSLPATGTQENTLTNTSLTNFPATPSGITLVNITHPAITGAGTTQSIQFIANYSLGTETYAKTFNVSVTLAQSMQQEIDSLDWSKVSLINNNLPVNGAQSNTLNQVSLFNGIPQLPSGVTISSISHPAIYGAGTTQSINFTFNLLKGTETYGKVIPITVVLSETMQQKLDKLNWNNLSSSLSEYGVGVNSLQEYQIIGIPAYSSVDNNIVLSKITNPSVRESGNYNVSFTFTNGTETYTKQVVINVTLNIIMTKDDENKYVQNYSSNADISSYDLADYIPESLIKVYPYRALYGKAGEYILNTGQTTFVRISQNGVDDFINLETDETGHKYVNVFSIIDNQTKVSIANTPSKITQTIRKVKSFTAITNDYFDTYDDKPDFFTIGEPYNYEKYIKGKQNIYYAQSFTPTIPEVIKELYDDDYDLNEDTSRISELSLKDVTELEAQFSKSKLVFLDFSPILDNIENIKVKVLPNIILDSIKLKGYNTEDDSNVSEKIDLDYYSTSDNLAWFQAVPIATKNKLSITTPWFDENVVLGKKIIDYILSKKSIKLSELIKYFGISDTIKDKITDMFLFSQQFNEQFGKVPRTSNGAIEPKWAIGNQRLFVEAIASSNPIAINDGLYKQWRKENPGLVGGDSDKFFKAFINAISSEVSTSLATGKGENDFNRAILPWTIVLAERINSTQTQTTPDKPEEGGYIELDGNDITVKVNLNSKYFEPSNDENNNILIPTKNINLSEVSFVEAERRITLPELPENLTEINKLSNPGDVSLISDNDLKYMVKLPLNKEEIEILYKGVDGYKPGLKTITIKQDKTTLFEKYSPWDFDNQTKNGHSNISEPAKDEILKQVKNIYPDANNIQWISKGQDVVIDDKSKLVVGQYKSSPQKWWIVYLGSRNTTTTQVYSFDKDFDNYLSSLSTDGWGSLNGNGYLTTTFIGLKNAWFPITSDGGGTYDWISPEKAKVAFTNLIAKYYNVSKTDIVITHFVLGNKDNSQGDEGNPSTYRFYRDFEYGFYIKRHNWEGYSLSFETNLPSKEFVGLQTIYDRPKWKQLIKSIVDPNNGLLRTINLKHKYEIGNYEISDIIISTIFGDFIYLDFGDGRLMRIDLYQKDDESSTTQVIKFF